MDHSSVVQIEGECVLLLSLCPSCASNNTLLIHLLFFFLFLPTFPSSFYFAFFSFHPFSFLFSSFTSLISFPSFSPPLLLSLIGIGSMGRAPYLAPQLTAHSSHDPAPRPGPKCIHPGVPRQRAGEQSCSKVRVLCFR